EPEPRREPERVEKPKPVARAPEAQEREREPEPSASKVSGDQPAHPALILSVGPRLLWRSLDYSGATDLNGYSSYDGGSGTGPGFTLALNAQWFPGAHVRRGWPSDI